MLPVTVIGGYLGAGKTTLVNHLLRHADGTRIAVLVNEFGALPIDEDLIEAQDDDLISIAGGCVCCSYGNDLMRAMGDLAQMQPAPDHVLIEASGVALPGAIAATLSLLEGVQVDGIVVLADAETIREQAKNPYIGDTIERQLSAADLVLLSKVDLVEEADLASLEAWLGTMAPKGTVVQAQQGRVPNAIVMQSLVPTALRSEAGGPHAVLTFASKVIHFDGPVDAEAVATRLADPACGLVRAKGVVETAEGLRAVQVVGRRWDVSEAPKGATAGIVIIAQSPEADLDRVAAMFDGVGVA